MGVIWDFIHTESHLILTAPCPGNQPTTSQNSGRKFASKDPRSTPFSASWQRGKLIRHDSTGLTPKGVFRLATSPRGPSGLVLALDTATGTRTSTGTSASTSTRTSSSSSANRNRRPVRVLTVVPALVLLSALVLTLVLALEPELSTPWKGITRSFPYLFLMNFRTFLGGFNPQKLPFRRLEVPWELNWRIELEESYPVMGLTSLEVE